MNTNMTGKESSDAMIAIQDLSDTSDHEMVDALVHDAACRILGGWDGADALRLAEEMGRKLVETVRGFQAMESAEKRMLDDIGDDSPRH